MNRITNLSVIATIAGVFIPLVIGVYTIQEKEINISFWLWIVLIISFSFNLVLFLFLLTYKRKGSSKSRLYLDGVINDLVRDTKGHITPSTLAFLGVAVRFDYPHRIGEKVANLNDDWSRDEGHWNKKADFLKELGLLDISGPEVAREYAQSNLGKVFFHLVLQDERYNEVASKFNNLTLNQLLRL